MLEVFQNHEKRTSEEAGSSERTHHLPYRSPSMLPLPSGRLGPALPVLTQSSKMPLGLPHPPTVPMQLASNVMVVPPQQIAASSSHQSFINTVHKRKSFPLAVAHPIMRQNPNFNPAMAHAVPNALPPKLKVNHAASNSNKSAQDSPLDLSAPLDLSLKRKNDAEKEDAYQRAAIKRQRLADASEGKADRSASPSRKCSAILSKPPPIYPGLHRTSTDHLIRQQRKVHPLIHEGSQNDANTLIHQKFLQHKLARNKEAEEAKLWTARQEFAMQSPKMLQKRGPPPPHPHLPVKRVQASVPPLVTSSPGSTRLLTHRDQVPALITPQQISEHNRLINEEKKHQLLARAAAMGIPVDKEPYRTQTLLPRSSQLIKENGAVDSEMEEALRQMMQQSMHRPSPSSSPNSKPKQLLNPTPNNSADMRRKLMQKAAYIEFMKKRMLIRSFQQRTGIIQERSLSSTSSSPSSSTQSPPIPTCRSSPHQEKQELYRRRYLYDMQNGLSMSSKNRPSLLIRNAPPSILGNRECDRRMKLVQGVGTNSGPQYKYSLKDIDHRQTTAASVSQERAKTSLDPRGMDLKTYHLLQRGHDSKNGRLHMYQELHKHRTENSRQDQVVPTQNGRLNPGCTASRGPASQGLPHPISRLTSGPSEATVIASPVKSHSHPPSHSDPNLHPQQDKLGAIQSHLRNRKNLINPEIARDHILASMNPTLRDLFQEKDQEKQLHLFQTLRKNHSSQLQRTKSCAINFRDIIAHEISKCIDESSDSSEVIDLTSEHSEGSEKTVTDDVSGRVGSPQTNPLDAPVSIESFKRDIDDDADDNPPPLIKSSDARMGFVPLTSNSVIVSGAVTYSKCPSLSDKCNPENISQGLITVKQAEAATACEADCKATDVIEPADDQDDRIQIKQEVGIKQEGFKYDEDIKEEFTIKIETDSNMDIEMPGQSSNSDLSDMGSELLTAEPNLGAPGSIKSVSYDPRRKVLAALNERSKLTPVVPEDVLQGSLMEATDVDPPTVENYTDTKIIPRADQADKECQLPDQLFEDDDKEEEGLDGEEVSEEVSEDVPTSKDDVPTMGEESKMSDNGEVSPEPDEDRQCTRPRRKRKRRVRRYYHIVPRRASSRKGTKRKPPQVRRTPAPSMKPKYEDFSPEVLQVRTRNADGRRRQAAMASSYHRDDRYEQEIEKERQKVMERRRRRTAVLRKQGLQAEMGQPCQEVKLPKANEKYDSSEETRESPRRRRCKATSSSLPSTETTKIVTDGGDCGIEDEDTLNTNEDYERRLMSPHVELKVRIQRKDLTGKFHESGDWQVVAHVKKPAKREGKMWPSPMNRNRLVGSAAGWSFNTDKPSTSGLFAIHLNGRRHRRGSTAVRRRLLKNRIIPDSRPSIPPPPRELKRLAVNKKLGETLLHKSARLGHDDSALYCINYCMQDINAKDNAGYTPLHECCVNGRLKVAKHMIAKGADVNGSAADGTRPLHDAIDNEKVELGRLLLAHGGDPLIATYSGRTTRKLARSKETKTLVHGYLKDINGRFLAPVEELEGLKNINYNIRFQSSLQTSEDLVKTGIDFMTGAPEASPEDEDDELMFELSDKPLLPSISMYLDEPKKFSNWLLLSDILQRLDMRRPDFLYDHRDVTVYSITREEMESSAELGPNLLSGILERNLGKTIELVELDDHICRVLGSDVEMVK